MEGRVAYCGSGGGGGGGVVSLISYLIANTTLGPRPAARLGTCFQAAFCFETELSLLQASRLKYPHPLARGRKDNIKTRASEQR